MIVREILIGMGISFNSKGAKQADQSIDSIKSNAQSLIGVLGTVGAALGIAFSVRSIIQTSDELTKLSGRINLVTKDMQKTRKVMDDIFDIAYRGGVAVEPLLDLFATAGLSLSKQGFSTDDITAFAETMTQLSYVSGLDNMANEALIRNLNQALGSGTFAGKDFADIRRIGGAPVLDQIANGMGVTLQEFQDLASAGKVSSKDVINALKNISGEVRDQFLGMPKTVEGSLARIGNAWTRLILNIQNNTGIFTAIAVVLNKVADGFLYVAKNAKTLEKILKIVIVSSTALGIAWGALKIAAFVKSLGSLTFALKYYTLITWQAARATIAATWPIIAIAAVLVLLALAIEDIYVWMNGGKSLIGRALGPWEDFRKKIQWIIDLFGILKMASQSALKFLSALIRGDFKQASQELMNFWSNIGSFISGIVLGIYKAIHKYFVSLLPESVQEALAAIEDLFTVLSGMVETAIKVIVSLINGDFIGALENLKSFWINVGDAIINVLKAIGKALWDNILSQIPGVQWIADKLEAIGTRLGSVNNSGSISGLGGAITNSATNVTNNVEVNVTAQSNQPGTIANQAAANVFTALKNAQPVGS